MPQVVNLRLHIAPEQMYCADCSRPIRSGIEAFLRNKQLSFDYVSTDYRKKTVEIAELNLPDGQTAENFFAEISAELESIGRECTRYEDMGAVQLAPANVAPAEHYELLHALPLLVVGTGLMLEEHLHGLPRLASPHGLVIDLSVAITATAMSLYFGQNHFKNAWRTHGAMDTLISLGIVTAISYSFLLMAEPPFLEDDNSSLYFSLPLMILGFLKLSHGLRDRIHAHIEAEIDTLDVQKNKLPQVAQTYLVEADQQDTFITALLNAANAKDTIPFSGQLEQLPVAQVLTGSLLCVEKNALIPIDSLLLGTRKVSVREDFYGKKGNTTKKPGEVIFAGSENTSGHILLLQTFCLAQDNHLKKAYDSFKTAASADANLELVSQYFLPGVLTTAVMSALFWGIFGPRPRISNAIKVFMDVLLSACPCGLGLIGIISSMIKGLALEAGILIQKESIFSIDQACHICLDKSGTMTAANYEFEKIISANGTIFDLSSENNYIAQAVLVEQAIAKANPTAVAQAIIQESKKRQLNLSSYHLSAVATNPTNKGRGGTAIINGNNIIIGNKILLAEQGVAIDAAWLALAQKYSQLNRLAIFLAINNAVRCLFILQSAKENDALLRPGVKAVIEWLFQQGLQVHVLSGDAEANVLATLRQLNIENNIIIRYEQKPQDKMHYVSQLNAAIMLGDDNNDLGAINQATHGLAIDVLAPIRGAADAVLNGNFISLVQLMCLAKTYRQSYYVALAITFGVNGVSLLAAAGVFYPITQQFVDPMITGMTMIASSLLLLTSIAFFKYLGATRITAINHSLSNIPAAASCQPCHSFKKWSSDVNSDHEVLRPLLDPTVNNNRRGAQMNGHVSTL